MKLTNFQSLVAYPPLLLLVRNYCPRDFFTRCHEKSCPDNNPCFFATSFLSVLRPSWICLLLDGIFYLLKEIDSTMPQKAKRDIHMPLLIESQNSTAHYAYNLVVFILKCFLFICLTVGLSKFCMSNIRTYRRLLFKYSMVLVKGKWATLFRHILIPRV